MVICSGLIGAALGALAGYLFLTESGRQLRRDLEPRLDDLARDFVALQGSVSRATDAAQQGWRAINEATGRPPPGMDRRRSDRALLATANACVR